MKNSVVKYLLLLVLLSTSARSQAQILFTESFAVILDSTKTIKGSVIPDFKFQTQRKHLLEFQNLADISIRLRRSAVTFANKIELSRFGKETFLSGGYVYSEYRRLFEHRVTHETYAQVQWAEARGLEFKYAFGTNLRYRIYTDNRLGIYAGIGPFFEYERWNHKGLEDQTSIPTNTPSIENSLLKIGSYFSIKRQASEKIFVDLSLYHQNRVDRYFESPRLASSSRITYKLSKHIGLTGLYQNIYDYKPVVPINKIFHRIIFSINLSF